MESPQDYGMGSSIHPKSRKRHSDGLSESLTDDQLEDSSRPTQQGYYSNHHDGGHPQMYKRRRGNDDIDVQRPGSSSSSSRFVPGGASSSLTPLQYPSHSSHTYAPPEQASSSRLDDDTYGVTRIPSWRVDASYPNPSGSAPHGQTANDGEVRGVPRVRDDGGGGDPQQWGTHVPQDEPRLTCPVPICRQVFVGKQVMLKHMRTHNEQVSYNAS